MSKRRLAIAIFLVLAISLTSFGGQVESNQALSLALDWYLKRDEVENLFDVHTINAVTEWELSQAFSFSTGVSLQARTGLERMVFNIAYEF